MIADWSTNFNIASTLSASFKYGSLDRALDHLDLVVEKNNFLTREIILSFSSLVNPINQIDNKVEIIHINKQNKSF